MLNILFLAHRFPFPADRGDRIRSNALIRHLAEHHRVSLAAVVDRPPEDTHLREAEKLCASVDIAPLDPWRRVAAACQLPTTVPLTVPLFRSSGLRARIDRRLRAEHFDLIFIYCSSMAQYVLAETATPKLIDFVDVDSQKWLDYARAASWPMKPVYWREGWLLRRYERRIASGCAHAFVTSEREAALLRSIAPRTPVTALPNGVSVAGSPRPRENSRRLVFTGVMDYRPNVDGVAYFVRDIWPTIRAAVPDAEFIIVGQNPGRDVRRLAQSPGVVVTGWVEDVSHYLDDAAAFVAPLRLGRGIQNKILQAMAAGLPVVSTSTGLAGIGAVPGQDVLQADTPERFAAHAVSLLRDADLRARVARRGAEFVRQQHQWTAQLEPLERILREVAGVSADAAA